MTSEKYTEKNIHVLTEERCLSEWFTKGGVRET